MGIHLTTYFRTLGRRAADRLLHAQPEPGRIDGYLIAAAVVALAFAARLLIAPLDAGVPYVTFFPSVVLAALLGGLGPGLFAILLGLCLTTFVFVPPYYTISWHALQVAFWSNMVFAVDGLIVCAIVLAMRRYQARLIANVTELRWTEQQLRISQGDLKRAQSMGHIGSWRLDVRYDELRWSSETYRIFGIRIGTPLSYGTFLDTVDPRDREYVDMKWLAALDGEPYDIEHRIVVNGEVKYVREIAELEFDERGKLLGGFGTVQDITRLKQSEIEYRQILRTTSDGFWLCDFDGRLLDVNDSYCRMTGYSREELLEKRIADIEADESPEEVARHARQIMATGCDTFETRHRRKDGTLVDLEISVNVSTARDDVFVVFARNITRRKSGELELELEKSRQELQMLYDYAPCGYHSLDSEGRIVRINQTEADWLGYTREELVGRKITDFQAPSSAQLFASDFSRFKREGTVGNIEVDLLRKDGIPLTVLLSSAAVYDEGGNYLCNRTTMIDITERKLAEDLVRRREAQLRALLDNVPYLIWMKDADSRFVAVNKTFLSTTGRIGLDEVLGKTDFDLWPEELASKYLSDDIEVMITREQKTTVERSLDKGELRWVETYKTPILDLNGKLIGTTGFAHDITDRIEQEERRLLKVREQRDVLVREVHHRIKNNLQGVVGLLRQHAIDYPELGGVIETVIGRIYSIALIHGLQAQSLSEDVDLCRLITGIIDASDGGVEYQNNLPCPVLLHREEAVPVALALNEMITNACKHRSAKSLVTVKLETVGPDTLVTIANRFHDGRQDAASGGQGISLVKSLLPQQSAKFVIVRAGDVFTAELLLSPPVTITGTGVQR